MFDWNDLKYFLAVARHGSTVGAAKALNVHRSTVRRRLDELERRLGRRLVSRSLTGYKLTHLGRKMVAYAERVEKTAQLFESRLSVSDAEPRRLQEEAATSPLQSTANTKELARCDCSRHVNDQIRPGTRARADIQFAPHVSA